MRRPVRLLETVKVKRDGKTIVVNKTDVKETDKIVKDKKGK
jgi:hypothetical protein